MKYSSIKKLLENKYQLLIPDRIFGLIDNKRVCGIIATDEDGRDSGSLVFEYLNKSVRILWLYVLPAARALGAGDGLMIEFFKRIGDKYSEVIEADIFEDENSDINQAYFSRLGFRFEKNASYEIMMTLGDMISRFGTVPVKMSQGVKGITEVEEDKVLEYLRKSERKDLFQLFRDYIHAVDWEISSIHVNSSGEVDSVLIMIRLGANVVMPLIFETDHGELEMSLKLAAGSLYLSKKATAEVGYVYLKCTTGRSRTIVGIMFDDVHPVLVRHGVLRKG